MLKVVNMCKKFSSQMALENINLEVRAGEFFSLLGPSGCGKTTLLRIISGFETPTSGELHWGAERIDRIRPQDRPFNMVFQRYGLFPHLSVYDNVAFGLRIKKVEAEQIARRVRDVLGLVGLEKLMSRLPETLSGGQAQRVAVARALVNEPKILLLDEPLSALDQKMREHMQSELRALQRRLGITFILVTHDQEEALALSDRIGVMNHGVLEQVSTPVELYEAPKSYFVAQFVGGMGSLHGIATEGAIRLADGQRLEASGEIRSAKDVEVFIRPDKIKLQSFPNSVRAQLQVQNISFRGYHYELLLKVPGDLASSRLKALIPSAELMGQPQVGESLQVFYSARDAFAFERPLE